VTAGGAIALLRRHAEAIRTEELARIEGKLAALAPEDRDAVHALTAQLVDALLHEPTARLRQPAAGNLVEVLCGLFALDEAA